MMPKIERIHSDYIQFPDRIEIGKAGSRLTVSFNADNPGQALDRIDSAMVIRDYAINALMISIEKEMKNKKHNPVP